MMTDLRESSRRGWTSPGQSLVEFALVLPLLLLLFMGLFDFGRAVYAYNTVSNAAKEAARVGIVDQTTATIQERAVAASIALDVQTSDVIVAYRPAGAATGSCSPVLLGCNVEVRVSYRWSAITPIVSWLGPIDMSSTARMPVERVFP